MEETNSIVTNPSINDSKVSSSSTNTSYPHTTEEITNNDIYLVITTIVEGDKSYSTKKKYLNTPVSTIIKEFQKNKPKINSINDTWELDHQCEEIDIMEFTKGYFDTLIISSFTSGDIDPEGEEWTGENFITQTHTLVRL